MTDLKIRIADKPDLDTLVRLAVAFRNHLGQSSPSEADFHQGIPLLLEDTDTEFFLAHSRQGAALGYVQCRYRYSIWVPGLEAEISDLFVIREARRQGVGLRLVEFTIIRATGRGCCLVGLNTNERNDAAIALYRRSGFLCERTQWSGGRQLWFEKQLMKNHQQIETCGTVPKSSGG